MKEDQSQDAAVSQGRAALTDGEVGILYGHLRKQAILLAWPSVRWGIDPDDILQEGLMAAVRSLETFDPAFGLTPLSWACKKGRFGIRDAIRESRNLLGQTVRSGGRMGVAARVVSLSDRCPAGADGESIERIETIAIPGREDWPEDAALRAFEELRLDVGMSAKRKAIAVAVWCEGLTMSEAAAKFGITESRAGQILFGLRTRIREERSDTVGAYADRPGLKRMNAGVGRDVAVRRAQMNARGIR